MIAKFRMKPPKIGLHSNGMMLKPKEFDAIDDYDDCYRYELLFGVLVVTEFAELTEAAGNDRLGYFLYDHFERCRGTESRLVATLPRQFISTKTSRWRADRLIWIGQEPLRKLVRTAPTIAIDFVPRSRLGRTLDYQVRCREFASVGVQEYWVIDRFQRRMTVHRLVNKTQPTTVVVKSGEKYSSPLLNDFKLPLSRVLRAMNQLDRDRRRPT